MTDIFDYGSWFTSVFFAIAICLAWGLGAIAEKRCKG